MAERPAVNASPLIFLSRAGMLDMLKLESDEIVIPLAVATEIRRRGSEDPTVKAVNEASWLVVLETPSVPALIQAWDLGEGESSVLSWAYANPGTVAITDDLAARLLFLSPFPDNRHRGDAEMALYRNRFVAALADRIFVPYAAPSSKTEPFCREILLWRKPLYTLNSDANKNILALGAEPLTSNKTIDGLFNLLKE